MWIKDEDAVNLWTEAPVQKIDKKSLGWSEWRSWDESSADRFLFLLTIKAGKGIFFYKLEDKFKAFISRRLTKAFTWRLVLSHLKIRMDISKESLNMKPPKMYFSLHCWEKILKWEELWWNSLLHFYIFSSFCLNKKHWKETGLRSMTVKISEPSIFSPHWTLTTVIK